MPLLALLSGLLASSAGEICDDFEDGDFGKYWQELGSSDYGGQWQARDYDELKQNITDFPQPASGSTVVYLTASPRSTSVSARLRTVTSYTFPNGSSISFRYWLRSQWPGSGTFEVHRLVGSQEEPEVILSLTDLSGPDCSDWSEASAPIPPHSGKFQVRQLQHDTNNRL